MLTLEKIPELRGFVETYHTIDGELRQVIKVWCPYCRRFHSHDSEIDAHKFWPKVTVPAHCDNRDSPFIETGYYLDIYTKEQLSMMGVRYEK